MSNLLDEMESDVKTPTIGDNSLKEMADLCAEQASLEEEMRQLEEQLKAKAKSARKLSQEIIPAKMSELGLESLTLKIPILNKIWIMTCAKLLLLKVEKQFGLEVNAHKIWMML